MRKKVWTLAAFAASGALMALSFQPFNLWPAAWFALVPAFLALRRCGPGEAGPGGLLFGLGVELVGARWTLDLFGASAVVIWFIVNLPWMIFFALAREVKPWSWPVLWVGLEFVRAELWPWKTGWFVLGASQASALPVLQAASLVGVFGLSAMLVAANAAWLMPWRGRAAVLAGAAVLVAVAQIPPPPDGEPVRVLLIQSEEGDRQAAERAIRAAPPADLIVLPEYFVFHHVRTADVEPFAALARERRAPVLFGGMDPDGDSFHSAVFCLDRDGRLAHVAHKSVPVPFFADGVPAASRAPWDGLGVAICYDMDFTRISQDLVGQGAELLVFPTMDVYEWGPVQKRQHAAMAPLRAVEQRRWLVRAASSGVTTIVAPDGRVVAELPPGISTASLHGVVARRRDRSVYSTVGWLLPWAALVGAGGVAGWAVRRSGRKEPRG